MKSNPKQKVKMENKPAKKSIRKKGLYSWLLTVLLLVCFVQAARSAFLNVQNYFSLSSKISKLEKIRSDAQDKNRLLKQQIKEFQTLKGVESVARNELKMAGEDEVLVLIKGD